MKFCFMFLLALSLSACGGNSGETVDKEAAFVRYSTVYVPFVRYTTVYIPIKNQPPIANAGADQHVSVWGTVALDGSGSGDGDRDFIGYSWSLASKPSGSVAQLDNPNSMTPMFVPDYVGDYIVALSVTDGKSYSQPSTLTVTALPYTSDSLKNDPSLTINIASSSFEYWFQDSTTVTVAIKFQISTSDGASHSFKINYCALDAYGNVLSSYYLNGGAPNVFQTSAQIDIFKYPRISKWVITRIAKYT